MSFRIERLVGVEDIVVYRVSGRIHAEHVHMLTELFRREKGGVAVDLREVTLVDREAVIFLALSEARGIELRNCAAYIREWIVRERRRNDADGSDPKTGGGDDIRDV